MVFSSLEFLFVFLPIFLVLYYCLADNYRNGLLFAGSILFYGLGEPTYLFLILYSVLVNYLLGLLISRCMDYPVRKKLLLFLSLLYNFGLLFYFKYMDFFLENINVVLYESGSDLHFTLLNLVLPLGISFYTFQIVSYIIDVYRGTVPVETSFVNLGAYLCMFPQLIAGPIVVYSDIHDALEKRKLTIINLDEGLKTFILGLGSKVILANQIGTLWNEVCMIGYESISTPLAWLGAVAYSMQLYFDFWGYSLMAIGLGKMLGFHMPVNFNHPYTARSVTDFWRRWHITLGAWFREYIYIPLGGNRKGRFTTLRNLLIVWFLVGFWHGADWNFILWGLLIFILQIIEKNLLLPFLRKEHMIAKLLSHAYMTLYILVSWTIFAISDFSQLRIYLARMFPFFGIGNTLNSMDFVKYLTTYAPLLLICLFFCTEYPKKLAEKLEQKLLNVGISVAIFWYAVYYLSIGLNNPFLYFRF
ncbi:MAG: MBOAT family protein [Lachnospiraceae bacterium]|nr:MBOAT family protein [Lachnospiraceae bacterium]MBQ3163357.1 MBOAT family protein [Lachnospiraceae bacterium]